jgi:hypothetical protein
LRKSKTLSIRWQFHAESSNAWIAKPSVTEVNSWPARIGVSLPNLCSKSFRINGTKEEPPVMKMASTSRAATLQALSSRSTHRLISETSGTIHSSNSERETRPVDLLHFFLNPKRRIHGPENMVVVPDGDIEKRHHRITEQAVDDTMLFSNDGGA